MIADERRSSKQTSCRISKSFTSTTLKLKAEGCLRCSITVADPYEASTIRPHFFCLHERSEEVRVQVWFIYVRAAQLQFVDPV